MPTHNVQQRLTGPERLALSNPRQHSLGSLSHYYHRWQVIASFFIHGRQLKIYIRAVNRRKFIPTFLLVEVEEKILEDGIEFVLGEIKEMIFSLGMLIGKQRLKYQLADMHQQAIEPVVTGYRHFV